MSDVDVLKCKIVVLRDALRRAQWYLGKDKQSSPPTHDETEEFMREVREILDEHERRQGGKHSR